MTSCLLRSQKSTSKSGGETLSRDSILSKSRLNLIGSMSVILMRYAIMQPAPLPRPGPTGMPCVRAQFMKSYTIRK